MTEATGASRSQNGSPPGTAAWTASALLAFAANSLLCREALRGGFIDPFAFAAVRIAAGAAVLVPLALLARRAGGGAAGGAKGSRAGAWISAAALVTYALAFSGAYTALSAGTGALILFVSVQVTMLGAAIARGEPPGARGWTGATIAMGGLVILLSPGLTAPDPRGAISMAIAGAAWGAYSLRGRGAARPLEATAGSFVRGAVLVLAVAPLLMGAARSHASWRGVALAAFSGGVTSGLGYVVWYRAMRGLTATAAALVQLAVPVIAAVFGAILLGESPTLRLVAASAVVLGGLAVALAPRRSQRRS